METKNFETFLKENLSELETTADSTAEISDDESTNTEPTAGEEDVNTEEPSSDPFAPATTDALAPAPTNGMDSMTTKSGKALYLYGGVDSLNSQESPLLQAMNQLTTALDCCEADVVKLYQLNIQPASSDGAVEPADGMSFIYEKIETADVIVFVSPVQDGDVSSLTQTLLKRLSNHYKNMELKNKIYSALLMGDQNSQQLVKADLANQANNLGLIVGAGTTIFDISQIQTLVQAVKEIKDATSSIRTAAPINTTVPGVMNFDEFSANANGAQVDMASTSQVASDVEKGDSFSITSDTNQPTEDTTEDTTGEESTEESDEANTETETDEKTSDETETETETEETTEETGDEEGNELAEEEEVNMRLPKSLLNAIKKSKHIKEEEEEIEETEAPTFESKKENTSMKKIHHIARFSEMKKDNTKNEFIGKVDNKKMSNTSVNPAPSVKKEVAPNQKVEKGGTTVNTEIKPKPDNSKMKSGKANPTAGAKNLGTNENGEEKKAKAVKKSVENFSDFLKK